LIGRESLGVELDQRNKRAPEVRQIASTAIDERGDGCDYTAMLANDIDRFLHAASAGYDIFRDDEAAAWCDFESATQDEFAVLLFRKDVRLLEAAGDFVAYDNPAESRGDYRFGVNSAQFIRQRRADPRGNRRVLKQERALEKLPAMQTAAQNKVTIEKRVGAAEKVEDFVGCHGKRSGG
jgi:hypothetical protein